MTLQSFHPPRRILMGPGPSDVSPRVLAALSRPTIGHLDPAFQALMEEIKAALADVAVKILSDRVPGRNAVATIIPIHGDIDKPDVQMWPTILAVLRNAFVEGLSASLSNLPPPQAGKKEGIITQARRTLSKGKHPPVKAQPENHK